MTKYPQYYLLSSLISSLYEKVDILLIGDSNELRAQHIPKLFSRKFNGQTFKIHYDLEDKKYEILKINPKRDDLLAGKVAPQKDLLLEFVNDLHSIGLNGKSILVDTTSIKHPLIFYLLKIFKEKFQIGNLFFAYSEPERYLEDTSVKSRKFELTDRFIGAGTMPGFVRTNNDSKDKLLVVALGFEGNRFKKAFEEVEPSERKTFAIVGFPSFRPNWQFYVYDQNQSALERSKAFHNIYRATANSPFDIYNILTKIKRLNSNSNLIIAPLGTKPHSIGIGMFATDNHEVQIYYDFPSFGKKIRTIGTGDSYIYNLTSFLNE
ncbi:MAG: hypothetical protein ACFHWX_21050 [Bacteroidota bacterium]